MPVTSDGRVRLTLDLSPRISAELTRLADARDISRAEAIRLAIDLLVASEQAADDGMKIGAWTEGSGPRRERVFVPPTRPGA